ncbi:hypothetical protein V9L05_17515 [Bernardetia sp. Wsw4-3y2]|uniref:hypothetical protein n=1 Tax=Bernardetia sp. Wsw4-3y2 TaxID=3127471 RepID=UPI0030D2CA01
MYNEERKVFAAFYEQPKTMLMVAKETNIERGNICYYVGRWKKRNMIWIHEYDTCPISKHEGVQFLTTNPNNSDNDDLTLF